MPFPELFGAGALIAVLGLRRVVRYGKILSGIAMVVAGVWICHSQLLSQRGSWLHLAARCTPPVLVALVLALIWNAMSASGHPESHGPTLGGAVDFLAMTPAQFEQVVAQAMVAQGFQQVQVTGGAGDLGVDIQARDPRTGGLAVAQCKRYCPGRRVSSSEMQLFVGMAFMQYGAQLAIYASTGGFTEPAAQLAAQHGVWLVDHDLLQRWLSTPTAA